MAEGHGLVGQAAAFALVHRYSHLALQVPSLQWPGSPAKQQCCHRHNPGCAAAPACAVPVGAGPCAHPGVCLPCAAAARWWAPFALRSPSLRCTGARPPLASRYGSSSSARGRRVAGGRCGGGVGVVHGSGRQRAWGRKSHCNEGAGVSAEEGKATHRADQRKYVVRTTYVGDGMSIAVPSVPKKESHASDQHGRCCAGQGWSYTPDRNYIPVQRNGFYEML